MDQEFSQALEAITDGLSAAREVLNSLKLELVCTPIFRTLGVIDHLIANKF